MRKYALDTNLYVRAFRSTAFAAELASFYESFAPGCYMSSVVLHELVVGGQSRSKIESVREKTARPFQRTGRVFTPSHRAWDEAAEALALLAIRRRLDRSTLSRSFVHDALISASCREAGVTLVTDDTADFERMRTVLNFEFVEPWPQ
ncbi:MAG: type II toxin-antitoxin system VapC family toxin [Longimicrobiales bacterium]